MKRKLAIYLAGSIKKAHEKADESYWTDADMLTLSELLSGFEISFLNPAFRTDDLSDQLSVFGRDMLQVFSSHVVFVDARDRRGLGVGAEMMWAKVNRIPVVTWAPKNTHYNKEQTTILEKTVTNYVHPFVESLSDKIVENLDEGAAWIDFMLSTPSIQIKDLDHVIQAMQHYKENQFAQDQPMQALLMSSKELKQRAERTPPILSSLV